ncbi:methyltransferase-like protein 7A isoform X2 [Hoplias malabaricus]|uniref:methyltransferase-like protein 7A isoform X2 n=1 Tax=Hoplias malabaricus TaxID=27720 RepID=UPI003461A6F9
MSILMHVCTLVIKILVLPLQVAELLGLYQLYKRVFPVFIYNISFSYNSKMNDKKRELFRELLRFSPRAGPLRLLEVGCGSGANFQHYPSGCRITCTDPNPHFKEYLQKNMDKSDHLVYEKFVVAPGEDLRAVEDNSVDVVVCTLVLCSVSNAPKVIQEAKRVLRPVPYAFGLFDSWSFHVQSLKKMLIYGWSILLLGACGG